MSKLKFTAEDFPNAPNKRSGALYTAQDAANDANACLSEMLASAPVVYGGEGRDGDREWSERRFDDDTHRARLVQIEELPRG